MHRRTASRRVSRRASCRTSVCVRTCVLVLGALVCVGAAGLFAAPSHAAEAAADGSEAEEKTEEKVVEWRRPPLNLRGGYTLDRGGVLVSYRFERVGKNELLEGTRRIAADDLLASGAFESVPSTLDLDRHVFSALWSPVPYLTFQLDLPFLRSVADQIHQPGVDVEGFETKSSGFGDVMFWVLYRVFRDAHSDVHLNLGLSFPSGSIAETQPLPLGTSPGSLQRLAYPLQLGSGTVDLQPGFTYAGQQGDAAWGFQGLATLRAGANEFDYILGNEYELTAWGGWAWNDWLSNSFTLKWRQRFEGSGADAEIDPASSPMADPLFQSGKRLDALFGLAITPSGGLLQRTRWVLDTGLPAWQDLDGPQPRTKWLVQFALEVKI